MSVWIMFASYISSLQTEHNDLGLKVIFYFTFFRLLCLGTQEDALAKFLFMNADISKFSSKLKFGSNIWICVTSVWDCAFLLRDWNSTNHQIHYFNHDPRLDYLL